MFTCLIRWHYLPMELQYVTAFPVQTFLFIVSFSGFICWFITLHNTWNVVFWLLYDDECVCTRGQMGKKKIKHSSYYFETSGQIMPMVEINEYRTTESFLWLCIFIKRRLIIDLTYWCCENNDMLVFSRFKHRIKATQFSLHVLLFYFRFIALCVSEWAWGEKW